ncbi:hypothetical protein SLE2022_062570 [Rubroshorea leprosula]
MGIFVGAPLILLFLQFFSLGSGDLLPVPQKDIITTKDLRQYLSLGDINIDLPALYVFGEAFVDVGNNKFLEANTNKFTFAPYGIDFGGGNNATGRVTNGRNVVDFIAQALGLPSPPPALGMSDVDRKKTLTGVNYGSAFGAILAEAPAVQGITGDVLTFDEQLALFKNTTHDVKSQFNSTESYAEYMSKALFFINMGSNDFAAQWQFYYKDQYGVNNFDKYAEFVSQKFSEQLEILYKLGARKIFVNNVCPVGCMLTSLQPDTKACDDDTNNKVSAYNKLLPDLLKELQSTLPGSKFVLGDLYTIFEDVFASPSSFGFTNVTSSCCKTAERSPCNKGEEPCEYREKYVFFDLWHPTESIHFLWARRLLKDNSVCSPVNLIQLVQA